MSSKSERDLCRRSIFPCTCEKGERVGATELLVKREMKREGRKRKRCKKKHDVAKGCKQMTRCDRQVKQPTLVRPQTLLK